MPPDILSPKQREWSNRVLGILGIAATFKENGESGSKEGGVPEGDDAYGKGYTPFRGITTPAIDAIKNIVEPPGHGPHPRPKMISAATWKNGAAPLDDVTRDNLLLRKNEIDGRLNNVGALANLAEEESRLQTAKQRILAAQAGPNPVDLTGLGPIPHNGQVAVTDLGAALLAVNQRLLAIPGERVTKKNEWTAIERDMTALAPILDAPENNPERDDVRKLIKSLNKIDAEFNTTPLTKDGAKRKCEALDALERKLFEWNDRRTQQGLPPSSESIAMMDLVQAVHRDLVGEFLDNPAWGPPVPGLDQLPFSEQEQVKKTWTNLAKDASEPTGDGDRLRVNNKVLTPAVGGVDTPEKAKAFQTETCAHFARLLSTESGRGLLDKLNQGKYDVRVTAAATGDGSSCGFDSPQDRKLQGPGVRGDGCGSTVKLEFGRKESAKSYRTPDGNWLTAVPFISLGHELVHAKHNASGTNRVDFPSPDDHQWKHMEEYQTILKGKTSEQSLRHQYGLSAERFSHNSSKVMVRQNIGDSFKASLDAADMIKTTGRDVIEQGLTTRGFDPAKLSDVTKVALHRANDIDGAALTKLGWNANELTVDQMHGILRLRLRNRLAALGWKPFELTQLEGDPPPPSLRAVSDRSIHHPRSPMGRQWRSLGGEQGLAAIPIFATATGAKLGAGQPLRWPTQLNAMIEASARLKRYKAPTVATIVKKSTNLAKVMPLVTAELTRLGDSHLTSTADAANTSATAKNDVKLTFVEANISQMETASKAAGSKAMTAVFTAMRNAMTAHDQLVDTGTGTVALVLKKLGIVTWSAAGYAGAHSKPLTAKGKSRLAECQKVLQQAHEAETKLKAARNSISSALEEVMKMGKRAAGKREDVLQSIENMILSPYIDPAVKNKAVEFVRKAREAEQEP